MRLCPGIAVALATIMMVAGANEAPAGVISQWNFNTVESAPYNSPASDIGSGVATVLGMDNNYTFSSNNTITGTGTFTFTGPFSVGSTASADITPTAGDPNGFANAWRIRGPSNNLGDPNGNGWALQAPQYTQGAQFSSGTVGYSSISFHFDWFTTTQGVKNLQEQYTLDGTHWININSPLTAVSNGWLAPQTIDFSGIAGANNDPNFGVRLVSVYDNSLQFPNYGSADGSQGGYYNNNSGNWRFADVGFVGTAAAAVPEPSSFALSLIGIGLTGLIVWQGKVRGSKLSAH
ncbi:MAG TPA: PEP-CTERM sorting domain-containing protein [Isosphaeraceae bacterium]|nr:PEP-CTERM sorting domain-containing protein [Isosphaeraceae bacterium]